MWLPWYTHGGSHRAPHPPTPPCTCTTCLPAWIPIILRHNGRVSTHIRHTRRTYEYIHWHWILVPHIYICRHMPPPYPGSTSNTRTSRFWFSCSKSVHTIKNQQHFIRVLVVHRYRSRSRKRKCTLQSYSITIRYGSVTWCVYACSIYEINTPYSSTRRHAVPRSKYNSNKSSTNSTKIVFGAPPVCCHTAMIECFSSASQLTFIWDTLLDPRYLRCSPWHVSRFRSSHRSVQLEILLLILQ